MPPPTSQCDEPQQKFSGHVDSFDVTGGAFVTANPAHPATIKMRERNTRPAGAAILRNVAPILPVAMRAVRIRLRSVR